MGEGPNNRVGALAAWCWRWPVARWNATNVAAGFSRRWALPLPGSTRVTQPATRTIRPTPRCGCAHCEGDSVRPATKATRGGDVAPAGRRSTARHRLSRLSSASSVPRDHFLPRRSATRGEPATLSFQEPRPCARAAFRRSLQRGGVRGPSALLEAPPEHPPWT